MKIEEFVDTSVFPWWIPAGIVLVGAILVAILVARAPEEERGDYAAIAVLIGGMSALLVFLAAYLTHDAGVRNAETDHYSAQAKLLNEHYGLEAQEKITYDYGDKGALGEAISYPGNYVEAGISYEKTKGGLERTPLVIQLDKNWNLTVYKSLEGDKLEELKPVSN